MMNRRGEGYAGQYASPLMTDRDRERFMAELIHAADTWEPGPDREACEVAVKLIREGGQQS